MGQAPPGSDCNSDGRGTPFVKAGEFGERRPIIREWTTQPLKFAKSTDVLVCVVGATCGKLNLGADCAIGRSVAAIRPNPSLVNQGFLYAFLQGWTLRLRCGSQGSAQGVITREMLASIPMPLPPLAEQERIVKLLDEADELRKLRTQADHRTADLIPSLFHEMFSDLSSNKHHWKEVPLANLGVIVTGNTPPRSDPRNYGEYIEWVKTDNIDAVCGAVASSTERLSEVGALCGRTVPEGSVLINCIAGSIGRIGDAAITDRKVAINQQINAIVPRENVEPAFLLSLVCARKSLIQSKATGVMTRIINKSLLEAIPGIEVPHSLQKEFAARVFDIRAMQAEQGASRRRLDDLFQSTLHRAFNGEL